MMRSWTISSQSRNRVPNRSAGHDQDAPHVLGDVDVFAGGPRGEQAARLGAHARS